MSSFSPWFAFVITFGISVVSLSVIFLSRHDRRALRGILEGSASNGAGAEIACRSGGHVYPAGGESGQAAPQGNNLETPEEVEQSIASLIGDASGWWTGNQDELSHATGGGILLGESNLEAEQETLEQVAALRKATVVLMTFMEKMLTRFAALDLRLGAADRFGSNLFVTGACEAMYHAYNLTHRQFLGMLETALAATGSGREVARRLAKRYNEYLLEPQYIGVFQAGSDAVLKFTAGDEEAADSYVEAIKEWRNPRRREAPYEGPVSVLFTDIVGSTKLTRELGDEGAQVILRVHNTIIRDALAAHDGTEIKHTGDGIMATFTKSAASVESAMKMIEDLEEHNRTTPDLPLHIRIGINAGEPIREDNDIFGSTVQMAARICDAAETDQVLVSMVVRELCGGRTIQFEEGWSVRHEGD